MNFSNNLRYLRKQRGISQDALADKLGYKSFTTIQKWESGVSEPSVSTLKIIANIFGVSMDQMINEDLSDLSQPSSSAPSPELTEQEERMLVIFRRLSRSQQERLIAYAEGMLDAGTSAVTDAFHHYGFMSAPVSKVSEGAAEYRCDVEQARREADEIVREEYKKAVKLKSGAK